ncbi:type II toxin-antitoxin system VapC family toxin [Actinokineospora sp.]|uniref:type II toxin-antitoxin system VapC family toxin n=1 Tax=Actinokineospora sp. TaxID=1872133 RepID=UPI0040379E6C
MAEYDRALFDTSVVIDFPNVPVTGRVREAAISAITLAELASGPAATNDPSIRAARQQRVQFAENAFDVVPVDTNAARYYGHIYALVLVQGRHPRGRIADLLIAATAAANDLPLFTRNPKDFIGLESVVQVIAV